MAAELDLQHDAKLSLFETVIRVVGGLLSAYDASHDALFLEKADELAAKIMLNMLSDGTGVRAAYTCLCPLWARARHARGMRGCALGGWARHACGLHAWALAEQHPMASQPQGWPAQRQCQRCC